MSLIGRSPNASEVLRDGLRLGEEREERKAAKLEAFRDAARKGFDAIDGGEYHDFDSADELDRYLVDLSEAAIKSDAAPA
ncbi:type II toxin-antitoxin system ParD family antitoxin [Edaphosphingomonas haloaromaticamans]|uniref:Uncharacterized protein n=1 Tax=Edaphosphingomonas haloaromaticamans TaxID=653954 RepID=A0A1S1HKJ5_9SPHN|nr:type II toxin-antitoxin system ParD family antitoxin [Sphingomonas haloaromaticamans]OHT21753.1 hypothetical protein BHE75_03764 [Sphingomonas haloaromaticamans]